MPAAAVSAAAAWATPRGRTGEHEMKASSQRADGRTATFTDAVERRAGRSRHDESSVDDIARSRRSALSGKGSAVRPGSDGVGLARRERAATVGHRDQAFEQRAATTRRLAAMRRTWTVLVASIFDDAESIDRG